MKKGKKLFLALCASLTLTFAMNVSAEEVEPEVPAVTAEGTHSGIYYVKGENGYVPAEGIVLSKEDNFYHFYEAGEERKTESPTLELEDDHYYLFDTNGKASAGLQMKDGVYYYFNSKGRGYAPGNKGMKKIDEKWYYFSSKGKGITKKLKYYKEHYYYFDQSGCAKSGKQKVNGIWYRFGSDGTGESGWITSGSNKYYARSSGRSRYGWVKIGSYYYYFDKSSRAMQKNKIVDSYKLDSNGRSRTRYLIKQTVSKYTNSGMSKNQKIYALWKFMMNGSYRYVTNRNHLSSSWKWPKGWTSDYAYNYYARKGSNYFGYAATFGYLVKEATGYQVKIYHGSTPAARGGLCPHGWACVKINGVWYAFDPDMYKFSSHSSSYYYTPYSSTRTWLHRYGVATDL